MEKELFVRAEEVARELGISKPYHLPKKHRQKTEPAL